MAWTATPKEITKNEDGTGLVITSIITDGVYSETLVRPMFRPKTVQEFMDTSKNWIDEVKKRKVAMDAVDALLPEVKKEINKPIPERVVAIEG